MNRTELRGLALLIVLISLGVGTQWIRSGERRGGMWVDITPRRTERFALQETDAEEGDGLSLVRSSGGSTPGAVARPAPSTGFPLDINTATESDLARIPLIGPKRASSIITYRKVNGPFTSLTEVCDLLGFQDATWEKIAPFVSINGVGAPRAEATSRSAAATQPLDINTATAEELEATLWNVGPVISKRIVEFRERNGAFRRVEDLTRVPGIGSATLERNRDRISVGSVPAAP